MAGLSVPLFILASLAAINANTCDKEDSLSCKPSVLEIGNQLRSLPEGNPVKAGIELARDFFKTSPVPGVGYLDPLYIESFRIERDDDEMKGYVDVSETTIKGLLGCEVTDIKKSLNSEKIQLDFVFPELSASGKYDMPSTRLLQQIDIYGNGEFVLTARNLHVQINVSMGETIDGDMFVEKLESQLSLEALDAKVTGLNDDELASEAFSLRLSENLPEYVPLMKDTFDEFLKLYTEFINTKLKFMKFLNEN